MTLNFLPKTLFYKGLQTTWVVWIFLAAWQLSIHQSRLPQWMHESLRLINSLLPSQIFWWPAYIGSILYILPQTTLWGFILQASIGNMWIANNIKTVIFKDESEIWLIKIELELEPVGERDDFKARKNGKQQHVC